MLHLFYSKKEQQTWAHDASFYVKFAINQASSANQQTKVQMLQKNNQLYSRPCLADPISIGTGLLVACPGGMWNRWKSVGNVGKNDDRVLCWNIAWECGNKSRFSAKKSTKSGRGRWKNNWSIGACAVKRRKKRLVIQIQISNARHRRLFSILNFRKRVSVSGFLTLFLRRNFQFHSFFAF